ncbi:MAG: hypothetical protein P1V18_00505 [Candidatus Gracilibacteria bacterium]|nr:hypothetical protein [Candidatus Gracilibacteria bacterium]
MSNTFHLTVRTPELEIINRDDVKSLKIMTEGGEMEIKPGHAAMTGSILFSKMIVSSEGSVIEYIVQRGLLFVSQSGKKVDVMVYQCMEVKDIEYKSAREYLDYIEEQLKAGADLNEFQMEYLKDEKIAMVKQLEMVEENE